ncbi:MAG TPA: FAD-dependent oxidoreductase [Rhodocyclaceae bacterium]|nr:FAD-dependent oxidoreductase [Rhodocyclaceae bacterium]
MKVIVIGGGWSGCAAAIAAARQGADVTLLERTDALLGTGLVGGIFRNNGRFTATEEMIAMGGGELFHVMDACTTHADIEFPGHRHAALYNIATIEPAVQRALAAAGVDVRYTTRIAEVEMDGPRIIAVKTRKNEGDQRFEADAFVETTGTAGVVNICNKYGNGCGMCVLRCHSFGIRVGIASRAGVTEINGQRKEQVGAMSGSCKLLKESLARHILDELNRKGVVVVPIPGAEDGDGDKLSVKACQQYALPEYQKNIVLLDTGHAKLMTPYYSQAELRKIPGFENARFEDPYSGGIGNSIRFVGMAPRDDALRVEGVDNLYCGGEKAGLLVGHTEAVVTGVLAGYNAARALAGEAPLVLPDSLVVGDAIRHVREQMATEEGLAKKFTFSGSVYFERMKERGTYTTDVAEIRRRVAAAGLTDVFAARGGAPAAVERVDACAV